MALAREGTSLSGGSVLLREVEGASKVSKSGSGDFSDAWTGGSTAFLGGMMKDFPRASSSL